ncbi:MAG: hypothetical protein CO135_03805 [Candidatus Levybacteria bacterium CG_4_9_14_3_um_filter_35_16]|nr:MAG: hypothetical protein COW87_03140 [Candidatus Levybacteria bacterium CG22_combo_CG10-13_8_21_14_all_35_11]PJA90930.1 MAG: hypothetical protein CO135_03805 [Candidatus Levybacteria bacterium CG_4_9_14_3_um_filter_35_16]PJC54702.1 MAG: hypothetical protein CO028_01050 [Candidatus Levybacteria bacterium CG_4_9_14_0_2_um_filter_35_21]
MNYGKAIRTIRASKGITQKEFSNVLDLDPSYISRIEQNTRTPSTELLELIAKKLDIPFYLLILLASEKNDLKNIESQDAEKIGRNLLQILLQK